MKPNPHASALVTLVVLGLGGAAEAAPTLITACGDIITPGSYKLANNVTASAGTTCLRLHVNNVTIDLDGFIIEGGGTGVGIYGTIPISGLTVRNGTIKNFEFGLSVFGNTMLIERMALIGNSQVGFSSVENIAFRDNIVTNNGIGVSVGRGAVVTGNIVNFNTGDGIRAAYGDVAGGTFVNNTVISNGGAGLTVVCPSVVSGNTLNANTGGDIVLSGTGCNRRLRQQNAIP
jgi:hypothetical protein